MSTGVTTYPTPKAPIRCVQHAELPPSDFVCDMNQILQPPVFTCQQSRFDMTLFFFWFDSENRSLRLVACWP